MIRRLTVAAVAAVIALTAITTGLAASPTPESAMEEAYIISVGEQLAFLRYGGETKSTPFLLYTGIDITGASADYPAYCINPEKPGPYVVGPYKVDTKDYITDPKIWGIVSNGYPYKTIGELGLATR